MSELKHNPLFTFALFAYNQERFIAEAVRGALAQTYSPLEVILSDDCSSDRTFEIMQHMAAEYRGPHQVVVRRNERNLGLIGHINQVMELARGEWIVAAAGDDVSLPVRTERIYQAVVNNGDIFSVYSAALRIDANGRPGGEIRIERSGKDSLEEMAKRQISVIGCAHAWRRELFDIFGPINCKVMSEDVVLPFRAALLGRIMSIDEILVYYRFHENNTWLHPSRSDFFGQVNWHKARFARRIENLIGIYQTKLGDLERLARIDARRYQSLQHLKPLLEKALDEAVLEKEFYESRSFGRLGLLVVGLRRGTPLRRLGRWVVQYSCPTLYYLVYRALRLLKV